MRKLYVKTVYIDRNRPIYGLWQLAWEYVKNEKF